jgi:hypothetical protein
MSRKISVLLWALSELADIRVNGIIWVSSRFFRLPGGVPVAYLTSGLVVAGIAQAAAGRSTELDSLLAAVAACGGGILPAPAWDVRFLSVRGNAAVAAGAKWH